MSHLGACNPSTEPGLPESHEKSPIFWFYIWACVCVCEVGKAENKLVLRILPEAKGD